jgi:predicted nuclease of predicted toxin-antitoxin system
MNFVSDENVDRRILERIRQDGHEVVSISDTSPRAIDAIVLDFAHRQGAVLVTEDKDFGDLVMWQRQLTSGVVLVRLSGLSPEAKAETVSVAIREHESEIPGSFTVISPGNVRIRRLDP